MTYRIAPVQGGFARIEFLPDVRPEVYDPATSMYEDLVDSDVASECVTRYGSTREELEDRHCDVLTLGETLGRAVA